MVIIKIANFKTFASVFIFIIIVNKFYLGAGIWLSERTVNMRI